MANDPAYVHPEALVSSEWLAAHLNDPKVRVVDATYHLPTAKRDPRAEYVAEHIRVPCSSTSTASPTRQTICRI
jgi:3-mercaptopyruvate sulfurtransferase SseA